VVLVKTSKGFELLLKWLLDKRKKYKEKNEETYSSLPLSPKAHSLSLFHCRADPTSQAAAAAAHDRSRREAEPVR
jgi:hypothetical protein